MTTTAFGPEGEVTIVSIPVGFYAHYQDGKITKFVLTTLESGPGYFGGGSSIVDGPEIGLEGSQSDFWKAIREAIADPGGFVVDWQE